MLCSVSLDVYQIRIYSKHGHAHLKPDVVDTHEHCHTCGPQDDRQEADKHSDPVHSNQHVSNSTLVSSDAARNEAPERSVQPARQLTVICWSCAQNKVRQKQDQLYITRRGWANAVARSSDTASHPQDRPADNFVQLKVSSRLA